MIPILALCVTLVFLVIIPSIIFYKLWWVPHNIQCSMVSQGIRGPPYRFLYGTTKEIIKMQQQISVAAPPMKEISHDIFPILQPHYHSWIKTYGNIFVHWVGTQPEIVVTDMELIKEIINNKESSYPKTKVKGYFKDLLGDGLVVTQGQKWSKLRKVANHAFHGECLKEMVPVMVGCVESMLENWRSHENKAIEVGKQFKLLTSEVISKTAFGSNYMEGTKIFDNLSKLVVLISNDVLNIRFFSFMRNKNDEEAGKIVQLVHDSIMGMVERREDAVRRGEAESYGSDFLGSLLRSHHETDPKSQITAAEIIDECKTFYFAGQDTTQKLLSWTMLLLSIHTEWQEEARKEVLQLFGKQNTPNAEGLNKLKIVNMILYETLRLYTPIAVIMRRISSRVKLGKYELPEGMKVAIPSLALHRDPEYWGQDAHLFNPGRFSEGMAKATNGNGMAFMGFGYGPRICVGLNFAINEAKIALAIILQRYSFTLSPDYIHSPKVVVTTMPLRGVSVVLHPFSTTNSNSTSNSINNTHYLMPT